MSASGTGMKKPKNPKKFNVLTETWVAEGWFLHKEDEHEGDGGIGDFDPTGGVDIETAEIRARLAAQAPEMARLLITYAVGRDGCIECGCSSHSKLSMCFLSDTLKAAGIKVKIAEHERTRPLHEPDDYRPWKCHQYCTQCQRDQGYDAAIDEVVKDLRDLADKLSKSYVLADALRAKADQYEQRKKNK